jgi:hypothetical protein
VSVLGIARLWLSPGQIAFGGRIAVFLDGVRVHWAGSADVI